MPRISFTQNLQRHVNCQTVEVSALTLRQALEETFAKMPKLRGYLLDDQGSVHTHVAIMVNGTSTTDRKLLSQSLEPDDEIYVMQALSGG